MLYSTFYTFFLLVSEAKSKVSIQAMDESEDANKQQQLLSSSRVLRGAKNFNQSRLVQFMLDHSNGFTELKRMSPADIDIELRMLCLSETNGEGLRQLSLLFRRCKLFVSQTDDFEIVQAFLHRLLQLHGGKIMRLRSLHADIEEVRDGVQDVGVLLRDLVQIALCLTKTYLGIRLI